MLVLEFIIYPSLEMHLCRVKKMNELASLIVINQLVDMLIYIHSRNVCHHDLKVRS